MTQADLAERASVDLRYLQRIEAAKVHAGVAYVAALAVALGGEPGELSALVEPAIRPHGRHPKV
ncbi:MAG: helix-turn-helix domain-containing protein [Deltaproteobacteria bacterium]|nr:helix-turn-helix domain-containing protein [Deltaproteobacteria bacterium]